MSKSFINQIITNQKVLIQVDDYNSFHKMARTKDFDDTAHYLSLFFSYHYIPYWQQSMKSKIDKLTDTKIKILGLWDGYYVLGSEYCEQVAESSAIKLINSPNFSLEDYDLIFNCYDSGLNPKYKFGLDEKIEKGEVKLKPDAIYISFKSSNFKKEAESFFKMQLKQTYSHSNHPTPILFTDREKKNSHYDCRIQYGPWPLDFLDWNTFPSWKKDERVLEKIKG